MNAPRPTAALADFIGRFEEIRLLDAAHRSRESGFIPIYGRRRIGKSELILHFLSRRRGVYFVGKTAPPALQIREFLQESARALDEPLLASLAVEGWRQAFTAVEERWRGPDKLVLALDEFQWMVKASPELPSLIQELWDRRWKKSGKVLLILCGSYLGFMEREVLGRESPLFGRRTAQIRLRPFDYREAALFHPSWSAENRAMAYFLCGGVPLYLRSLRAESSLHKNIEENFLTEYAPLFREPDFLLREELREVENYYAVLLAIASGETTTHTIALRSGVPERSLPYYLDQLIQLGYVARRHPLIDGPRPQRRVRFVLEDALLRFWFRFVFPNLTFIQQMGPARSFTDRIRPGLDAYFGHCFERLCREALPRLYEREGVHASFEVGEYWDKDTQIDVVGVRGDQWIDLGECKWGPVSSQRALKDEFEDRVRRYPNKTAATLGRRLFVRKASKKQAAAITGASLHTLEDLYR